MKKEIKLNTEINGLDELIEKIKALNNIAIEAKSLAEEIATMTIEVETDVKDQE